MVQGTEREQLDADEYVPHETERKRAVLMYTFIGAMLSLGREDRTVYETFHLKQSLGFWILFFFTILLSLIFLIVVFLLSIGWGGAGWFIIGLFLLVLCGNLLVCAIYIKQAREGTYKVSSRGPLAFPYSFGNRLVGLFAEEG